MSPLFKVNYCLIYGTSETYRSVHICVEKVNYYLDYRTSETILQTAQTKGGGTTAWFAVLPKPSFYVHLLGQNELLLDLWYLRNIGKSSDA